MVRALVLGLLALGLSGCLGYVVVLGRTSKTQNVDCSSLTDLRLEDGIRSLKPVFPDAGVDVSGGAEFVSRSLREDGLLERLYFFVEKCYVVIDVYTTPFRASCAFDRLPLEVLPRAYRSPDENKVSGTGHERLCLSPIRENRNGNLFWGWWADGTYHSYAIVQNRNVLIVFEEWRMEEPVAQKQGAVDEVARVLRLYSE